MCSFIVFSLQWESTMEIVMKIKLTYSCDHSGSKHSWAGEFPEAVCRVVAFQTQAHLWCVFNNLKNKLTIIEVITIIKIIMPTFLSWFSLVLDLTGTFPIRSYESQLRNCFAYWSTLLKRYWNTTTLLSDRKQQKVNQ